MLDLEDEVREYERAMQRPVTAAYKIVTPCGKRYIHKARSGQRLYSGMRSEVVLWGFDDNFGMSTWKSLQAAEQVLDQARAQYPLDDLKIVKV